MDARTVFVVDPGGSDSGRVAKVLLGAGVEVLEVATQQPAPLNPPTAAGAAAAFIESPHRQRLAAAKQAASMGYFYSNGGKPVVKAANEKRITKNPDSTVTIAPVG